MRLRNKKTGEIVNLTFLEIPKHMGQNIYNSLAELNEEWEDVPEEPKSFWTINTTFDCAEPIVSVTEISKRYYNNEDAKSIGNYFETKEEAEKAVEKLKAWERLKEKGFKSYSSSICGDDFVVNFKLTNHVDYSQSIDDFDCIFDFGGEE